MAYNPYPTSPVDRQPLPQDPFSPGPFLDAPEGIVGKGSTLAVTVSGLDIFDALGVEGEEGLSMPFAFSVWLRLNVGKTVPDNLPGKSVSITLKNTKGQPLRSFHGHIAFAEESEPPYREKPQDQDDFRRLRVRLVVRPRLWFLTLTKDCRIFQKKSPIEIIKNLLSNHGVQFSDQTKSCGKSLRDFCVQYQESIFDFVCRLMAEEGIFYYFTYTSSSHTMVLADANLSLPSAHVGSQQDASISYWTKNSGSALQANRVWKFQRMQQAVPSKVSSLDYDYEKPDQQNMKALETARKAGEIPLEIYDYPGHFQTKGQGDGIMKRWMTSYETPQMIFHGLTSCPTFSAGTTFTLKDHTEKSLNGKKYTVLRIRHIYTLSDPQGWHNRIEVIPYTQPYKPPLARDKPRIWGSQTGLVTGKSGEEIYTDAQGRITVKFHWDYRGRTDESSSCWIRVVYGAAGNQWGMIATPRVGQEVLVQFEDGDPDRPIVVGCLYNGTHKPPYVGQDKTKSGIKSHSTKQGDQTLFNEFSWVDEKKKERVYLQAAKDYETLVQEGNEKHTLNKGSRTTTLEAKGDKPAHDALTLKKGNHTIELDKGDQTITLKMGKQTITLKSGNQTITLDQGNQTVSLKNGNQETTVSRGHVTIKAPLGKVLIDAMDIELKAKTGIKLNCTQFSLDAKTMATLKASMFSAEAKVNMTVKGAMTTVEGQASVTLKGAMASVNGSGMASVKGAMVMLN